MSDEKLPDTTAKNSIESVLSSIPEFLVPRSIKALDRLIGATVDIPVAWLNQQKAKIDAQTDAFSNVEKAIGEVVAKDASANPEIVEKASNALIRKAYRKHSNLTAVSVNAVENLRSQTPDERSSNNDQNKDLEDDWLNVFERHAEDASSERMQSLWGRVLAGEIRNPGKIAIRTLRFLSEFSQTDARLFEDFANKCFGGIAPTSLVKPSGQKDLRDLLALEEAGLIQGASGPLNHTLVFNEHGNSALFEAGLAVVFRGQAKKEIQTPVYALTQLGHQVIPLSSMRNQIEVAAEVANAMRSPVASEAYIGHVKTKGQVESRPLRILWQDEHPSKN